MTGIESYSEAQRFEDRVRFAEDRCALPGSAPYLTQRTAGEAPEATDERTVPGRDCPFRMIHSATTTFTTQPAPINMALLDSLGLPTSRNHGRCVNTCVPAPRPMAYPRI